MTMPQDKPLRRPRQERSRKTLSRLLDATERLLEDREFEAIPVAEIVREAGTSVGAFYTRFRDKGALLPAIYERYQEWLVGWLRESEAERSWEGLQLRDIVAKLARHLVELLSDRRHMQRAVALYARLNPEKIDRETRERRVAQMRYVRDAVLSRREEITHPDPERAADLAVFFAASACREAILFSQAPHAESVGVDLDELVREVERLMLGYLTGGEGGQSVV